MKKYQRFTVREQHDVWICVDAENDEAAYEASYKHFDRFYPLAEECDPDLREWLNEENAGEVARKTATPIDKDGTRVQR